MQQQINQQEQCGSQQVPQPVMICPVQYVYDTSMMLPQPQENQIQQNQILINVKTPPPWIQNRTQNQVVYVQQLPNHYQPYIHPQMIQNPIYHPQMSYQIQHIQPMLAQDNRQLIQIPNLNHYNMIQNPSATTPIANEETEKMPLLTQMLNQKANVTNNRTQNNNVRPNMTPTVNTIRPITHNQQVQTDNTSHSVKGRPRNIPPQIITINPMQQRQLMNQKQETPMNIRPTNIRNDVPQNVRPTYVRNDVPQNIRPTNIRNDVPQNVRPTNIRNDVPQNVRPTNIRNDVPQHIKTKIPSSISVKTINRPILPRTFVRPLDVMPAPQTFYYNPNIMPSSNTETKNIMTNTEPYVKPDNIPEMNSRTTIPMQYSTTISNMLPVGNMIPANNSGDNVTHKQIINTDTTAKPNVDAAKIPDGHAKKTTTEPSTVKNIDIETQTEDKLVRNTVFVQARGRLLNDKGLVQNQSLKRSLDDRLQEETKHNQDAINDTKSLEEANNFSKKIKVEVTDHSSDSNNISTNSPAANMNIKAQQSRIRNLQVTADNVQKATLDIPEINKINNVPLNVNQIKSEEKKPSREDNKSAKVSKYKENCNSEDTKVFSKPSDKFGNKSVVKEETNSEYVKKKESKITVLTHVLEGYIIQESNVAFPIQKPIMEKGNIKEPDTPKNQEQNDVKSTTKEDGTTEKHDSKGHFPWRYLNKSIESEKEMEFAVVDKDDPFANIKKPTVESWTADQLASHFEKHNWTETASKLLDEEIDGESMLLVNKDQLVAIGVSEEHADVIVAFAAS